MKSALADRSGQALRAAVEALEFRQLLAADFATLSSQGTLSLNGTAAGNLLKVDLVGGKIVARRDSLTMKFDAAKVKRFYVNGFGGNDKISINVAKPATLIGGSGDDTFSGSKSNESVQGDGGNDTLLATNGIDLINPGSGLATVDYSGMGTADLILTPGQISAGTSRLAIAGKPHLTILGTSSNDHIVGNVSANVIIYGLAGNDEINVDSLDANPTVYGGEGDDDLIADGDDYSAILYGDSGNDTFRMEHEANWFDVADGGAGTDTMIFDHDEPLSDQHLSPGVEAGYSGRNGGTLIGNELNNTIYGSSHADRLEGAGGDDTFILTQNEQAVGTDTVVGGSGHTTISYATETGIDLHLQGSDSDLWIESALGEAYVYDIHGLTILGTNRDDTLHGRIPQNTVVRGLGGSDTLNILGDHQTTTVYGGDGNDRIWLNEDGAPKAFGDAGDDTFRMDDTWYWVVEDGEPGIDTQTFDFEMKMVNQHLAPGIEIGIIDTDGGELIGNELNNTIYGSAMNDTLDGAGGDDVIYGNDGDDSTLGADGNDILRGGAGNDTMRGGAGGDNLFGNGGHDLLFGDADPDAFFINDGETDTVDGGDGSDFAEYDGNNTATDVLIAIEKTIQK